MGKELFTPATIVQTVSWDLEQINEISGGWDNRWNQVKRGEVQIHTHLFNTPRVQFTWMSYTDAIFIEGSLPPGSIALSLIRTRDSVFFRNQKVEPYELVIITEKDEIDYLASSESQVFTLTIEENYFYQYFFWYFGYPFDDLGEEKKLAIKEEYADQFILQMQHWLKFFQNRHNGELDMEQYYGIEQEILGQLFSVIRLMDPEPTKERFDLAKVREVMHDNIDKIYSIGDLLSDLNISARTMQYHFKQKFGMTPKQYLHHLRLNAIRKELIKGDPERVKIYEVALKYGFFHSSHFGSEYKKIFGETPLQTLERIS